MVSIKFDFRRSDCPLMGVRFWVFTQLSEPQLSKTRVTGDRLACCTRYDVVLAQSQTIAFYQTSPCVEHLSWSCKASPRYTAFSCFWRKTINYTPNSIHALLPHPQASSYFWRLWRAWAAWYCTYAGSNLWVRHLYSLPGQGWARLDLPWTISDRGHLYTISNLEVHTYTLSLARLDKHHSTVSTVHLLSLVTDLLLGC